MTIFRSPTLLMHTTIMFKTKKIHNPYILMILKFYTQTMSTNLKQICIKKEKELHFSNIREFYNNPNKKDFLQLKSSIDSPIFSPKNAFIAVNKSLKSPKNKSTNLNMSFDNNNRQEKVELIRDSIEKEAEKVLSPKNFNLVGSTEREKTMKSQNRYNNALKLDEICGKD